MLDHTEMRFSAAQTIDKNPGMESKYSGLAYAKFSN
jgi:hypothetical protein